ncbi:hypothetical protein CYMTET_4754 [Cymbomonas tetramitiformis]|uniref:Uncharacterized protein n=1 Tax=Cymbomonas tetramitiformis TaxID=36881 RepID=A0AAE0H0U7_9CHLO|nr:hypothetical protein CYMTET_4754 [Cymbomonas tetramitiformis]
MLHSSLLPKRIFSKATDLRCEASQEHRWVPVRKLAAFNGLCQSLYLAVAAARLYLQELYFILAYNRSWRAKVKLTRQAFGDFEWGRRLRERVLNLQHVARGFWGDDLRNLHITHLELEALCKTVQIFLGELRGKKGAGGTLVAPYWPGLSSSRELEAVMDEMVLMLRRRVLFALSRLCGCELLGTSTRDAVMFRILERR